MGVGFAIPSNLAKAITTQLIEHGEVTRGYLGIVIQQLTSDLAESFGIEASQGILVAQVSKHSPQRKQVYSRAISLNASRASWLKM